MVQVSIQHTEYPAGLAVAQAYPVAVARPCRLPGRAAAYGRSLGKPVASLGNELVTFFAEKDNVLSYKMITLFPGIHLRPFKTKCNIAFQFLAHIIVGFIDNLLHADDIRLAGLDDLEAYILTVVPAPAVNLIGRKSCNTDVTTHHIMS